MERGHPCPPACGARSVGEVALVDGLFALRAQADKDVRDPNPRLQNILRAQGNDSRDYQPKEHQYQRQWVENPVTPGVQEINVVA
jgi:hypothetical protein